MKISYRTHPILEKLHKGELGEIPLLVTDNSFLQIKEEFKSTWNEHKDKFAENITYVTKPFVEAASKTFDKMMDLLKDMINNGEQYEFNGTFIHGSFVYMIEFKAVGLDYTHPDSGIDLFIFLKEGEPLMWYSEKYGRVKGWLSQEIINGNAIGRVITTKDEVWKTCHDAVYTCVTISMFKTFAAVETKMLPAGKRVKDINCKYVNDTKFNVLHLDSKWFTNLVKSDGFKVRGHFRLQPKIKDGKWTKELIWINEFKKTGYTSPARKLSINENAQ